MFPNTPTCTDINISLLVFNERLSDGASKDVLVQYDFSSGQKVEYEVISSKLSNLATETIVSFTGGLIEDSNGDIWLGSNVGLIYFSKKTEMFKSFPPNPDIVPVPDSELLFLNYNSLYPF